MRRRHPTDRARSTRPLTKRALRPIVPDVTDRDRARSRMLAVGTEVEPYDFERPSTLSPAQLRLLEGCFEQFAHQWGTTLTAKLRLVSTVTFGGARMLPYRAYSAGLPSTSAVIVCALDGYAPRAVVQVPAVEMLSWIGRMLGGTGKIAPTDRPFTVLEQALVGRMVDETLEDLRFALDGLLPMHAGVEQFHHIPADAIVAEAAELMIVADFSLRVGTRETSATVAIPAAAVMPQLGDGAPAQRAEDVTELLRSHLIEVPVELGLRFTPTQVGPATVLHLAEGDVIPLSHPQHLPLALVLDDETIVHAAVGANGDRLACVIVDYQEAS